MGTHIEWIDLKDVDAVGYLRHAEDFVEWGDDWQFGCMVVRRGDQVEFIGGRSDAKSKTDFIRVIQEARPLLRALNVKLGEWKTRLKSDKWKTFREKV